MAATVNTFATATAGPASTKGESVSAKTSKASGKSGKASTGFATAEDFNWLPGTYTECIQTGTSLFNGTPFTTFENDCEGVRLEITQLQLDGGGDSHSFRAYYYEEVSGLGLSGIIRWTYHGTASLDARLTDRITMRTEYVDMSTDGGNTWNDYLEDHHLESDANIMSLTRSEDGKHIFADHYSNSATVYHHVETSVSKAWVVGE